MTILDHQSMSLWYGTPDAPAPGETVVAGTDITITIGVHPVDASNHVELHYRVNQGQTQRVAAKWLRNDPIRKHQYFGVRLPAFRAGDTVEYLAICRCAGRQVPSREHEEQLSSAFHVVETEADLPSRSAAKALESSDADHKDEDFTLDGEQSPKSGFGFGEPRSTKSVSIETAFPRTAATQPSPLALGELHPLPDLARGRVERLFRAALFRACSGTSIPEGQDTLWKDGDNEVLLHIGRSFVRTGERLIVAVIPFYTDQTGESQIVIPFVTNATDDPLGLIAATETKPRGPADVVDIFGDALVASAWAALVETATAWAGAAGETHLGVRLAPAGLAATKTGLLITGLRQHDALEER